MMTKPKKKVVLQCEGREYPLFTEEEILSWPTRPLTEPELVISADFGEWLDEYCDGLEERCMDDKANVYVDPNDKRKQS